MFLDGYRAVDEQFEFHERIGHRFAICAVMCINAVNDWMVKTYPKDDVMFIFEKWDSYQGDLLDMLRRDKRKLDPNAIVFMDKCWKTAGKRLSFHRFNVLISWHMSNTNSSAISTCREGHERHALLDAKGYRLPRRAGVPEVPIPHELQTMKEIMGDKFHGQPANADRFQIVPSKEPLGTLRRRGR